MSAQEVRKASDQFYATLNRALNGGISEDMLDVFSKADDVTTMHPLGGRQTGWAEVRPSWEMAANAAVGGSVDVSDLQITMLGSDAAYTIGTETASASVNGTQLSFSGRCTNVYRRENGIWKLVHHHVDLMPGVADAFEASMSQAD